MAGLTCFICGESEEEDGVTVKERGVKTFIESSKRRKDGKHTLLQGKSSVFVHNKCQKIYTKEQNIEQAARGAATRVTRSIVEGFDFKENCLFCGKDATEAFKKKETKKLISKRDTVHEIQTLRFTDSIKAAANDRDDAGSQEVLRRIGTVADLVAAEGRYHGACFKQFLKPATAASDHAGRRESSYVSDCINFICNYMEENEDICQFTLDDILKTYSGYVPKTETIRKKLIEWYNDDVIVVSGSNQFKQTTICFRNTGHAILTNSWYESKNTNMHDERLGVVKAAALIICEDIRSLVYPLDKYPSPDLFLDGVNDDNFLNPQQWGWKTTKHGLLPNATDQPAAPQELLNRISCTCGKGCRAACSCRKAGIKCSVICTQCKGHTCTNSPSEDECLQLDVTSYEEEVDITEDRLIFDPFLDEELDADTEMAQHEDLEEDTPSPSSSKRRRKQ